MELSIRLVAQRKLLLVVGNVCALYAHLSHFTLPLYVAIRKKQTLVFRCRHVVPIHLTLYLYHPISRQNL